MIVVVVVVVVAVIVGADFGYAELKGLLWRHMKVH